MLPSAPRSWLRQVTVGVVVPALAAAGGCATGRGARGGSFGDWVSDNGGGGGSNSGDSSKSDNSGDSSKSDNSGGDTSQSKSDGSSDSHSETSGTVTTEGDQAANDGGNVAVLILTGLTLLGLAASGATVLLNSDDGAQAYLDKHAREVRLALARGRGAFVSEVAHNLGLAPAALPHLGEVLRGGRARLEALLGDGHGFMAELVRTLRADPELRGPTEAVMRLVQARS